MTDNATDLNRAARPRRRPLSGYLCGRSPCPGQPRRTPLPHGAELRIPRGRRHSVYPLHQPHFLRARNRRPVATHLAMGVPRGTHTGRRGLLRLRRRPVLSARRADRRRRNPSLSQCVHAPRYQAETLLLHRTQQRAALPLPRLAVESGRRVGVVSVRVGLSPRTAGRGRAWHRARSHLGRLRFHQPGPGRTLAKRLYAPAAPPHRQ